ncbi:MAG: family 43 glycosylhydrolase [Erysipelotrichaceae bacterium]|nr:family 43 glycosylhydrolase [Erysipelotrichaceae bacterium]
MKNQIFNPYLPNYEYIPDGEPHVFGDRLYVFGSHDRFGASFFCDNDYVLWSAPINDLSEWTCHGVIYTKDQDPLNRKELNPLFAPDVCQGTDGRYYLYYCPCNTRSIGVAVCDTPSGRYGFLGHVCDGNGQLIGQRENDPYPFDPAVLVDDGNVFLYVGFSPDLNWDFMEKEFGTVPLQSGPFVIRLSDDMHTILTKPKKVIITDCPDPGHDFFEASSIRKINGFYYFVYSSWNSHELCYAIGADPEGPFTYKGILHDNGDIGIVDEDRRVSYTGNNHGSLVEVNGQWYVFGHRQTFWCSYARQGVAEKVYLKEDGTFDQAEMTSCGLNEGDLLPEGSYGTYIACHLTAKDGAIHYVDLCDDNMRNNHPAFIQDGEDREKDPNQYITNMRDGSVAGFKYFSYKQNINLSVKTRGDEGLFEVRTAFGGEPVAEITLVSSEDYIDSEAVSCVIPPCEKFALYFTYKGKGRIDFYDFTFHR